jgi:hypothetical protein
MLVAVHAADTLFFVAALAGRRAFATSAAMRLGGNVEGEKQSQRQRDYSIHKSPPSIGTLNCIPEAEGKVAGGVMVNGCTCICPEIFPALYDLATPLSRALLRDRLLDDLLSAGVSIASI